MDQLCLVDSLNASKLFAIDRVDHALFKTTQEAIPITQETFFFLEWLSLTCISLLLNGIGQDGVLSPTLFMVYMDDLLLKLAKQGILDRSIILTMLSTNEFTPHVVCIYTFIFKCVGTLRSFLLMRMRCQMGDEERRNEGYVRGSFVPTGEGVTKLC